MVHVPAEAGTIHPPEHVARLIRANGDVDLLGGGGRGGGGEREERSGLGQRVVPAMAVIEDRRLRGWRQGGIGAIVVDGGQSQPLVAIGA